MELLNPAFFYFSTKDTMEEIIFEMEIEMMGYNNFSVFVFLIYFFYSFYLMMFLLAPSLGFSSFAIEIIQLRGRGVTGLQTPPPHASGKVEMRRRYLPINVKILF